MKPRFLVLLAAYNGMKWIEEQVTSILSQQDILVNILISVDQSNDGTESWVDGLAAQDERVSALPHGQRFGGAALNFFRLIVEADARGYDYIAFADQDDIWMPNKLIRAKTVLASSASDGYSSNVTAFWPDGREKLVVKSQPQTAYDYLFEAAGPGCSYVLTNDLFNEFQKHVVVNVEYLNNIALHDWYCYAFSRSRKFKWTIDSVSSMRYRQHSNNQFGVNSGAQAIKLRLAQVVEGWWLNQSRLTVTALDIDKEPIIKAVLKPNRMSTLKLALQGYWCRRRVRDKFAFSFLCLLLTIIGQNK